ncbi:MAG: hypothetical protein NTX47_07385 [Candidatus Omnitrophica bacterium]|nr:hypothetical protein [Candidatus Omnitrophota bacterium]
MDKIKSNFMIVVAVLIVLCIVLAGYAASLNSQLSAEKTKVIQLNDQIAGLNAKANGLQTQLTSLTAQAGDQTTLVNSLQGSLNSLRSSLDTANAESEKLKTAYADLESKLKTQVLADTTQSVAK